MSVERRRAARRVPGPADPLCRARLRTGPDLAVTEISDFGASVRTGARLLPGTHVDVHLVTSAGRVLRRARVTRAAVCSIDAPSILYQVALAFDAPVDSSCRRVGITHGESPPHPFDGKFLPTGTGPPAEIAGTGGTVVVPCLADLALDLEKGADLTFAKESGDVDQ